MCQFVCHSNLHMMQPYSLRKIDLATPGTNAILGFRCPCCDSQPLITTQTDYNVDHFGSILLSVASCKKCGYKHSDIFSLEKREPILLKAKIDSIADLDIKVIKSDTTTIRIPEFGAEITPGPYSEGFITNVEGVLSKVEDALTFMLSSAEGDRLKKGENMLKQMRLAREFKPRFTLILEDPFGNCGLVSSNSSIIEDENYRRGNCKGSNSDNMHRALRV